MSELQASLDRLRHLIDLECFHHAVEESCIADIRAVLDAVPQWRPIETAPKDGTGIIIASIVLNHVNVVGLSWWTGSIAVDGGWCRRWRDEPTHWIPLPSPPTTEGR